MRFVLAWAAGAAVAGLASIASFAVTLYTFGVTFGVISIFAWLMTVDELGIYRRSRKREPKHEPPTRIPPQSKRPIR